MKKLPDDMGQDQIVSAIPTKVLNVSVPTSVYWHIRRCASQSRMSVKAFMSEFCQTATPINAVDTQCPSEAESEDAKPVDPLP
jgi:hypothetical protein